MQKMLFSDALVDMKYDVIVIGAGLGGLTAAALLAKKGLKTLVVEHHYIPGGCCTSIRRKDVTIDIGTALFLGFAKQGFQSLRFLFNEIEEEIKVIRHSALYRMRVLGKNVTFWPDINQYLEELIAVYPNSGTEIRAFYQYMQKIYFNTIAKVDMTVPPSEMKKVNLLKNFIKNPLGNIQLATLMYKSTEKVLRKYITNPDVIAFFDMLCSFYSYTTANETPAILSATMFVENHVGGGFYTAGSAQMLPNTIEKAIEKFGSQILYRHKVEQILVKMENGKGKAHGVQLTDGREIYADYIISNTSVYNLYEKLIPPEFVTEKRIKWVRSLEPTYPSFTIYLIVDREAIPEGTMAAETLIESLEGIKKQDITLYIPTIDDFSISPPNYHSVTIIGPSPEGWPRPWDPIYQSAEYIKRKNAAAEEILNQVEKHIPNFKSHIRSMEIGTPSTIERFTLKNWGSVGGPKQMMGQQTMNRLHATTEIKNLFACGDSTVMGISAPSVTASGVGAANMVLRANKMEEFEAHAIVKDYIVNTKETLWISAPGKEVLIDEKNVKSIARECQHCQTSPCREACPAKLDIPNIIRRIEMNNNIGAATAIVQMLPFKQICGEVCPSHLYCEKVCKRLEFAKNCVRIRDLHQYATQKQLSISNSLKIPIENINNSQKSKIAIIGGGPAGLTAAHYLQLIGISSEIFEKQPRIGGLLNLHIANGHLLEENFNADYGSLAILEENIHFSTQIGSSLFIEDLLDQYESVIIAIGDPVIESKPVKDIISYREKIVDKSLQQTTLMKLFRNPTTIEIERNGKIVSLKNQPRVYLIGDIVNKDRSIVRASASGRIIVEHIAQAIKNQGNIN